jgi:NADPH:quinone reductase-like Zn-dependent oxidoreductase
MEQLFIMVKKGGVAITTLPFLHIRELISNKLFGGKKRFKANFASPSSEAFREVSDLIDRKNLRLRIATTYLLEEYRVAHQKFEAGMSGKILIKHDRGEVKK